jgi:hypothetical protein
LRTGMSFWHLIREVVGIVVIYLVIARDGGHFI